MTNTLDLNVSTGESKHYGKNVEQMTKSHWDKMFPDNDRYYKPIEMGQYTNKSMNEYSTTGIQPSVHIGVCPVPQLTTTNASFVPDQFTDVECTWDIETYMECEFGLPYYHTHFSAPHIMTEHAVQSIKDLDAKSIYREDLSSFDNKYIEPRSS